MNTLGEKVTRLPWAASRTRRARPAGSRGVGGEEGVGVRSGRPAASASAGGAAVGGHRRHLIGGVPPTDRRAAVEGSRVSPAASASTSQRTSSAVTRPPGRSSPATIRAKASRLDSPETVKTTSRARAMAGKVRVIRSWGLLAVGVAVGHHQHVGVVDGEGGAIRGRARRSGRRGPSPRWTRSKARAAADLRLVGGGGGLRRRRTGTSGGRTGPGPPGRAGPRDHAVVGVGVVGRHAPLVAQADVDRAPVDARSAGRRRPAARSTRRAVGPAGEEEGEPAVGRRGQRLGDPVRRRRRAPSRPADGAVHRRPAHWGSSVRRPPLSSRSISGFRHSSPDRSTSRSAMWGPQVPAG